ncbi:MAG: succinate dehydrogenase cytochrome b subunit [Microthrixaceae bacterium]|nr:succinate dehydrogenase cytochrome b subunit [Microthrixaceae bacterium]
MTQAIERPGADAPVVNRPQKANRPWIVEFASSAVGKKWIMALSGLGLIGFVIAHAFGNLKMYFGPDDFDHYAESLRTLFYPIIPRTWTLWGMRIGLVVLFVAHIGSAISLTRMNQHARPTKYASPRSYIAANFASRTMRWTGIIVALYLVFHLADLTWGFANPDFVRGDAYDNLVASFERVPVAIIYIVSNIALGIHLFHGAWSMFQSMGINSPRYNGARRAIAAGVAGAITIVNVSFPLAVLFGIVG